jgi:NTE family protein
MRRRSSLLPFAPWGLAVTVLALGCSALRVANQPLQHWEPDHGYRPSRVASERPTGDLFLLLAFSGGGTRAASLAYGVLQELRDTPIETGAGTGRLLDEVDAITSVSGGSFAAAYYGLHGDGIFEDFETRFLRRDVQSRLILSLFNPLNWLRMAVRGLDRSELAVRYYDREIFDGATFADLLAARGPMLRINATDLGAGYHFTFFQPQFDLLCSDLSSFSVARAVTASSAVPVAFSPIVLRNYAGQCGFVRPPWLDAALRERATNPRRFRAATIVDEWLDASKHPYLHLLDGGIADNIGLRGPIENVLLVGGVDERLRQIDSAVPRQLVVIVVNAEVHKQPHFTLASAAPGLANVLGTVSGAEIRATNFDTLELMRETLKQWARELPRRPDGRRVRTSLITIGFDLIEDADERDFFNGLPTSFRLPDETVDRLIAVARRLLRESEDYQELVRELRPAPEPEEIAD